MDGTLAEIRLFAGTFPPRNWAFCQGQLLPISTNQALFSLIGTYYGGDGRTTFGLPDLRGRVPIGTGTGPGLTTRVLGQMYGFERHIMSISELPAHNHTASFTQTSGSGSGVTSGNVTITPQALKDDGDQSDPTGNIWAQFVPQSEEPYANYPGAGAPGLVDMHPMSGAITAPVAITDVNVTGAVTVNNTGSNIPFNIMQPWLCLEYIICITGLYPARN